MATGVSGYFDLTGDNGAMARVHYAEYYDAIANQSTMEIGLQIASSWYSGVTYYLDGGISAGGQDVVAFTAFAGSNSATLPALNTYVTVGGSPWTSGAISHNTDGTGAVEISISIHGYTKSGGAGSGWAISGSKTVTLTDIPRSSTIGATDANIGAVSMIAVGKKHPSYTHSIQYQFGDLSGYITADGGVSATEVKLSETSIPWVVPESFYSQIPNAKSGWGSLTCRTYSGSTQIGGAKSTTFTATAAESVCRPSVSGAVVDINDATKALTGSASILVRYMSTARCTITASAKNGASIAAKTINGISVTGGSLDIPNVDNGNIVFTTQDSRGYAASDTVSASMIPYVLLTNNATAARTDPTSGNARLVLSGNCFVGSFGAVDNAVTATYKIGSGAEVPIDLTVSGDQYDASVDLSGLDYTKSHTIHVTVSDKLSIVTKKVQVNRGIPVFDWGENDFNFNVPVNMNGKDVFGLPYPSRDSGAMTKGAMLDLTYPVGSIYMSTSSTSPASLFGGTWERITQRFLFAADGGGGFPSGTTGGEATHTLTYDEIPAHWHYVYVYYDYPASTTVPSSFGMISNSNLNWSASERTGKHRAGYGFTDNTGGGKSHNNMPPYLAVYMWKRVA